MKTASAIFVLSILLVSCENTIDKEKAFGRRSDSEQLGENAPDTQMPFSNSASDVQVGEIRDFLLDGNNRHSDGSFSVVILRKIKDEFGDPDYEAKKNGDVKFSQDLSKAKFSGMLSREYNVTIFNNLLNLKNTNSSLQFVTHRRRYGLLALNIDAKSVKPGLTEQQEWRSANSEFRDMKKLDDSIVGFIVVNAGYDDNLSSDVIKDINRERNDIVSAIR